MASGSPKANFVTLVNHPSLITTNLHLTLPNQHTRILRAGDSPLKPLIMSSRTMYPAQVGSHHQGNAKVVAIKICNTTIESRMQSTLINQRNDEIPPVCVRQPTSACKNILTQILWFRGSSGRAIHHFCARKCVLKFDNS